MKIIYCLLLVLGLSLHGHASRPKLMPMPTSVVFKQGQFRLNQHFNLTIAGNFDERIRGASARWLKRLSEQTLLVLNPKQIGDKNATFKIHITKPAKVALHEDESYQLTVKDNQIVLAATTDIGAIRGLETLLQLLQADTDGYYFPHVEITDRPRFPWRGLLIDVCRHFIPIDVIKRNIDGMAMVKLNVLHLHLTDDQGFRIESKTYPKLHQLGADGLFFTQEQIKEIIAYAANRGIRVVPEFDIPGHATSWFAGYPQFASAPGPYPIETKLAGLDNAPTFDPTKKETYTFLKAFFNEMAALFPDEYMHIGGDENNGRQWNSNLQIQDFKKQHNMANNHQLQGYFNQEVRKILVQNRKKMMGWDEIFQPGTSNDIVIQSWRGKKTLFEAAKQHYPVILSHGYYIDLLYSAKDYYLNDPLPTNHGLTAEEQQYILGGEAAMWAELVTAETIDSRIWPSTAAIAERLWSAASVNNVADMYERLASIETQLEYLGLSHQKNRDVLLKRLTNGGDISALKTLTDVIEPMKGLSRRKQGTTYYTYTPLTMIADAARPDSKVARKFEKLVKTFVSSPTGETANELKTLLLLWQNNDRLLQPIINQSPSLHEISIISTHLAALSGIALDMISYLEKDKKQAENVFSEQWQQQTAKRIQDARLPRGSVEISPTLLDAFTPLVQRVLQK